MTHSATAPWRSFAFGVSLAVLAAGAAYLGWALGRPDSEAQTSETEAAQPAILREFELDSLEGERIGPATLEGRAVVVDFWATWCRPCDVQAKLLEKVYEEYADRDVDFVAVSVGEEEVTVRDFVVDKPYSYPVLIDPEGRMLEEGQVYMLPTVMVLDENREIAFLREGITGAPKIRAVLDEILARPASDT